MYWHIDTDAVSLIVIASIYVFSLQLVKAIPSEWEKPQNRRFLSCLHTGIVVTAIDIAASVVMEIPVAKFWYHFWMTLYFSAVELVIIEWFLYVVTLLYRREERGFSVIPKIVISIYIAYVLFVAANPWSGLIYSLGENNEYTRGAFFGLCIILFALYTLALFVLILVRYKKIPQKYPAFLMLMTPVILAVAIFLQLSFGGMLLILPAYMICLVLAFLFLQLRRTRNGLDLLQSLSKAAMTDKLTGLYNRTGMEAVVQRAWEEQRGCGAMVLIVDLDELKSINDSLGHTEGDHAIAAVASQLTRHFPSADAVIRYGGDEFLVFVSSVDDIGRMSESVQELGAELGRLVVGDDDTPIHCSVGAVFGVIGEDKFEDMCNRADSALYFVKRNGKNGCAIYPQFLYAGRAEEGCSVSD